MRMLKLSSNVSSTTGHHPWELQGYEKAFNAQAPQHYLILSIERMLLNSLSNPNVVLLALNTHYTKWENQRKILQHLPNHRIWF